MKFLRKIRVRGQPPLRRRRPGQGKIGRGVRQMAVRMHSGQYPAPNRQQARSSVSEHTIMRQRAPHMASAARLAGRQRRRRAGRRPPHKRHTPRSSRASYHADACGEKNATTHRLAPGPCTAQQGRPGGAPPCTYPPAGPRVIRPNSVVSNSTCTQSSGCHSSLQGCGAWGDVTICVG